MKVETAENKGVNPEIEGVDGKDKHGRKFERLKVETAETMVVKPEAAKGLDAKDKHRCGSGAAGVELQRVLPPSTMMMDGLTAFPRDPFPDAVKYSDFAQGNSSHMFWEQDYVRRVFKALTVGEMDLKEVSKILGVTINTIRLQYRKLYGFSYSSSGKMGPSVVERLRRGEITLSTAATTLGVSAEQLAAYVKSDTLD
ncbi:uncharacterized protein [Epargyreus clarus]|uniref:uncharacterized protein n=1 Tax=Epargyreus clarus TaxID=520877 RepID=UPI003C301447